LAFRHIGAVDGGDPFGDLAVVAQGGDGAAGAGGGGGGAGHHGALAARVQPARQGVERRGRAPVVVLLVRCVGRVDHGEGRAVERVAVDFDEPALQQAVEHRGGGLVGGVDLRRVGGHERGGEQGGGPVVDGGRGGEGHLGGLELVDQPVEHARALGVEELVEQHEPAAEGRARLLDDLLGELAVGVV